MNKDKMKRQYTQISRRIYTQFVLSVFGVLFTLLAIFFLGWFICSRVIWYEDDLLYNRLKAIQLLSPYIIVIIVIISIIFFAAKSIKKPLRYLDDLIDAAKSLSNPGEAPIRLPAELRDAENELNLAREQSLRNMNLAKEAEQRKNDLVVYLAHDLKTPLTSVIGYLTLLQDEPQISPELRAKYTGIALDKAERLEELINEFFDITRFSLTTLTLNPERTSLSRMLEQITSEFYPILTEKELIWHTEIAPNVDILCDRDKLERVFDNLIRNAINYSYPATDITLKMESCGENIKIIVSNHGKTISPENLKRIFEQFFRLDSSRSSSTGGSGLGLAISKEIVELHGGQISAESENESITFTVILPSGL